MVEIKFQCYVFAVYVFVRRSKKKLVINKSSSKIFQQLVCNYLSKIEHFNNFILIENEVARLNLIEGKIYGC